MYRHCEVLETRTIAMSRRLDHTATFEDALALTAK
jgi:hypothetical protein